NIIWPVSSHLTVKCARIHHFVKRIRISQDPGIGVIPVNPQPQPKYDVTKTELVLNISCLINRFIGTNDKISFSISTCTGKEIFEFDIISQAIPEIIISIKTNDTLISEFQWGKQVKRKFIRMNAVDIDVVREGNTQFFPDLPV